VGVFVGKESSNAFIFISGEEGQISGEKAIAFCVPFY
jgi:hypothetical protein